MPAAAAQDWLAPAEVSDLGEDPQGLQLAGNARGDAVALWENRFAFSYGSLRVAARRAGGAWGGPLPLARANMGPFGQFAVAIAPQGRVIAAVWQELTSRYYDAGSVIRAVVGPAGSIARHPPVRLSTIALDGRNPQVTIDRRGDAIAVWEEDNREIGPVVRAAVRPAGRLAWRAPVTISGNIEGNFFAPFDERKTRARQIAVDANGQAVVVWKAEGWVYAVVGTPMTGAWREPVRLGTASLPVGRGCGCLLSGAPRVAFDANGDAVVVWGPGTVQVAVRPAASGIWRAPVHVSRVSGYATNPEVAVGANGDVAIVWAELSGGTSILAAEGSAARDRWGAPVQLDEWSYHSPPPPRCRGGSCAAVKARVGPSPQVALSAGGKAVAVWESQRSEADAINAALKPAGSGFWRRPTLLAAGSDPWVAMDESGEALAAWRGRVRNPQETLEVACEPVVQAAVLLEPSQTVAKRTSPSSSCSSTSAASISRSRWPRTSESVR
jgi:hypothetical protein